jgi:hypothetical protein
LREEGFAFRRAQVVQLSFLQSNNGGPVRDKFEEDIITSTGLAEPPHIP